MLHNFERNEYIMKSIFTLEIFENRLYVKGEIPYISGDKVPQIMLGKNAKVKSMSINGNGQYKESIYLNNDYFKIYSIDSSKENGTILIEYDSIVEGENNILSEDVIALSLYSNTFPTQLPEYIDESICYFKHGFENYDIINSYRDIDSGLWAKNTIKFAGEIVNIVGYRKGDLKSFEVGNIKVYYRTERSYNNLYECAKIGVEAFSYYNKIYPCREAKIELIELGLGNPSAYCRGDLIVIGAAPEEFHLSEQFPKDFPLTEEETREWLKYSIFTHELGHRWFCGADMISYEDWLNETGAEWSSLMFLLQKGEKELFYKFYTFHEYQHKLAGEPIKPKDSHKPNSVHDTGVVLFYKIYEKYGIDSVLQLLQILSKMENPSTDKFLDNISKQLSSEIADFIRNRLYMSSF